MREDQRSHPICRRGVLEVSNTALGALPAVSSVSGTGSRAATAEHKAHTVAAAEAKADKKLLAHVAKGEMRLFRSCRDIERCSGPALALFEGCAIRGTPSHLYCGHPPILGDADPHHTDSNQGPASGL